MQSLQEVAETRTFMVLKRNKVRCVDRHSAKYCHSFMRYSSAILLIVLNATNAMFYVVHAQTSPSLRNASMCGAQSALDLIQQQIDASKTFTDIPPRISVLIRASDLLWSVRQEKARDGFVEAFDLAKRDYKEKGDEPSLEGRLLVSTLDQRYRVIAAIAKRDPIWARQLSTEMLQEEAKDAEVDNRNSAQAEKTAGKLLSIARSLLTSDPRAALGFARLSFRYPATVTLPVFLYELAEHNKENADIFYREALTVYSGSPLDQFLYLASYPFGMNRNAGEMPNSMFYQVPITFSPTNSVQSAFIYTLLRRAQALARNPSEARRGIRLPAAAQIWIVLNRVEPFVPKGSLEAIGMIVDAKTIIVGLLSESDHRRTTSLLAESPASSLDDEVKNAEKQSNPDMREQLLAFAVLHAKDTEELARLVEVVDKINNNALRKQLLNRLYFVRAQVLVNLHKIDDAKILVGKIEELDERAYLYSVIATESIKKLKHDSEARALLEEVSATIIKAPNSEVKVRALLGVAFLYNKIEPSRSIALLGDAVKVINSIEQVDLSRDYIIKRIEGKSFGSYVTLKMPGFNPENAFREIGRSDFDSTLYQAGTLDR